MSLIIEDELFSSPRTYNIRQKNQIHEVQNIFNKFIYQNQLANRNFQCSVFHSYKDLGKWQAKLIIPFKNKIFDSLNVWYCAKLDNNSIYLEEKLIIARNQLPYQVKPFKKKLQAIRQIHRSKQGQPKFTKICISQQGIIQFMIPKIVLSQQVVNSFRVGLRNTIKGLVFTSYIQNIVKFTLSDSKQTLKNIFNKLTDVQIPEQNPLKQAQKETELRQMNFQLFRYLARSSIQLRFDCTEGSALYEQVIDITVSEQKQIEERISHMKEANQFKLNALNLYVRTNEIFEGKQKEAFYMTAKQKQITKNLLQIPQITPIKQGAGFNNFALENKYIFNNIVLQIPQQNHQLTLLCQSGFGRIQYGVFNFWYLMNTKLQKNEMEQNFKQSNKIKNKYLVVKSPKEGYGSQAMQKYLSKQIHQIQVINRLKGLSCALIPRFYKVEKFYPQAFNQVHKQYIKKYENVLLSQLTSCHGQPGYNVGNLIQKRWITLTLKKAVYIMSQVAQALRFLHLNKIVHVDLKPQNILFLKNFSIKLIDFGESYHPLVTYKSILLIILSRQKLFQFFQVLYLLTVILTGVPKSHSNSQSLQTNLMFFHLEQYFMSYCTVKTFLALALLFFQEIIN